MVNVLIIKFHFERVGDNGKVQMLNNKKLLLSQGNSLANGSKLQKSEKVETNSLTAHNSKAFTFSTCNFLKHKPAGWCESIIYDEIFQALFDVRLCLQAS